VTCLSRSAPSVILISISQRVGWIRWAELIGWADPLTVVNGWSNMADPTSENGGWPISLGGWSTPLHQLIWLIYYPYPNRWLIFMPEWPSYPTTSSDPKRWLIYCTYLSGVLAISYDDHADHWIRRPARASLLVYYSKHGSKTHRFWAIVAWSRHTDREGVGQKNRRADSSSFAWCPQFVVKA